MSGNTAKRSRALVVGSGMSGLLAARVLADHFHEVVVLDRDGLPEDPEARKGVPQDRHLHTLTTLGSGLLEDFFPGLDAGLESLGAPLLDQSLDAITAFPQGRLPRFESGMMMRAVSRSLLEREVRRRVESLQNVSFVERREVTGLLRSRGRVSGVSFRVRGVSERPGEMESDLVVDASGNASRAPRWLVEIGHTPPDEEVVDARLGYATRWYEAPKQDPGWQSLAVLPEWPENPRGGTLRIVEGGMMTVVLIGIGDVQPPSGRDAGDDFERYAKLLPERTIYDAIRGAKPVSPVYGYRRTANRRRRYDLTRMPEGFIVTGDAACVLNPSYGQGMTLAALSAKALQGSLAGNERGFERRFRKAQAKAVATAWRTTTASDRQWSAESLEDLGLLGRYVHRVSGEIMKTATRDERTARDMLAVKNLLDSPTKLLRPTLLIPAAVRALGGGKS